MMIVIVALQNYQQRQSSNNVKSGHVAVNLTHLQRWPAAGAVIAAGREFDLYFAQTELTLRSSNSDRAMHEYGYINTKNASRRPKVSCYVTHLCSTEINVWLGLKYFSSESVKGNNYE